VLRELRVRFVIDSSKDLCWLIDAQEWAAANGVRTFNILLWKDPIDQAYSHWKRGQRLLHWRRQFVGYYTKALQVGLPFLAVNYNELVANPQQKLGEICAAIGMSYFEGKELFWQKRHHYLFGSGGVRRQVKAQHSTIRPRGVFAPEFEARIDCLRKQVATDAAVQRILEALSGSIPLVTSDDSNVRQRVPSRPYPLWYYKRRLWGSLRRYLAEPR
jgi:hypothetical protein